MNLIKIGRKQQVHSQSTHSTGAILASTIAAILIVRCATSQPHDPTSSIIATEEANLRQQYANSSLCGHNVDAIAPYLFVNSANLVASTSGLSAIGSNTSAPAGTAAFLSALLDRIGPDMRPASGFSDFPDVGLDVAKLAWTMMHQHAQVVATERVKLIWPLVEQLLREAKVSQKCFLAASKTAQAAQRLQTWAIQLLNSWGSFPAPGLFEGTLGDVGSFHGCLGVEENSAIGHAHYCTFSYRPVLPTRRDYEVLLVKEPGELLNLFRSDDAFNKLASMAQYNHYVYYKLGTCFPIDCSPLDAQKFARILGRRSTLLTGPVKCHSKFANDYEQEEMEVEHNSAGADSTNATGLSSLAKLSMSFKDLNRGVYIWKPHIKQSQWMALICVGSLIGLVLLLTLADLLLNRIPKLCHNLAGQSCTNTRRSAQQRPPARIEQKSSPEVANGHDANNNSEEVASAPMSSASKNGYAKDSMPSVEHILLPTMKTITVEQTAITSNGGISSPRENNLTNGNRNGAARQKSGPSGGENHSKSRTEVRPRSQSFALQLVHDCSLITNTGEFFSISERQLSGGDILCMNGLRCITMSWIIVAHSIQYNDWSAFARIYDVELQLRSLVNQPVFNGSYLVDTFFLMSGLLTSYSVFRHKTSAAAQTVDTPEGSRRAASPSSPAAPKIDFRELWTKFSSKSYLIGRYLRLTPQILLVSLLFILLPLSSSSSGPHWIAMTGEYSENCSNNWWISLLHLQAFYKSDEMCNFVCWWISVDMLYHLIALALILLILRLATSGRAILSLCSLLALANACVQASRHYGLSLPPNLLSTIPQTGAMWTQMTLQYFWTPVAHLFPFMFGFYLGFALTHYQQPIACWLTRKRALAGWIGAIATYGAVLFGTHCWVIGAVQYSRATSTAYALLSQLAWSLSLAWTIVACHFGYGHFIDRLLSCRMFVVLSRASYLVYLSHFLVLFTFFGSQNLLLEPTRIMISYIIMGNICLSMAFGSLLCIAFELPWLKIQKRIMRHI